MMENRVVNYEMIIFFMYIISISVYKSMTYILPIYIVLAMIPCIRYMKTMETITFLVLFIYGAYIIYGLIFQNRVATLVTFFGKVFQFLVFLLFCEFARKIDGMIVFDAKKIVIYSVLIETIVSLYLFTRADIVSRITAGNQPVGGNISVVILPLIIYSYFRVEDSRKTIILCSLVCLIWVILSGTRGYMLVFILSMLPIYWKHFISFEDNDKHNVGKIILFGVITVVVLMICFFSNGLLTRFIQYTRFGGGLNDGRMIENKVALDYYFNASFFRKIFGVGYGSTLSEVEGFMDAVASNSTSMGVYLSFIRKIGSGFHNLYGNILIMQGAVGIITVGSVFRYGFRMVKNIIVETKYEKMSLLLFWIGYFMMIFFRWSCDCGITEMIIFSLVLGRLTAESVQ